MGASLLVLQNLCTAAPIQNIGAGAYENISKILPFIESTYLFYRRFPAFTNIKLGYSVWRKARAHIAIILITTKWDIVCGECINCQTGKLISCINSHSWLTEGQNFTLNLCGGAKLWIYIIIEFIALEEAIKFGFTDKLGAMEESTFSYLFFLLNFMWATHNFLILL